MARESKKIHRRGRDESRPYGFGKGVSPYAPTSDEEPLTLPLYNVFHHWYEVAYFLTATRMLGASLARGPTLPHPLEDLGETVPTSLRTAVEVR